MSYLSSYYTASTLKRQPILIICYIPSTTNSAWLQKQVGYRKFPLLQNIWVCLGWYLFNLLCHNPSIWLFVLANILQRWWIDMRELPVVIHLSNHSSIHPFMDTGIWNCNNKHKLYEWIINNFLLRFIYSLLFYWNTMGHFNSLFNIFLFNSSNSSSFFFNSTFNSSNTILNCSLSHSSLCVTNIF